MWNIKVVVKIVVCDNYGDFVQNSRPHICTKHNIYECYILLNIKFSKTSELYPFSTKIKTGNNKHNKIYLTTDTI